MKFSDFINKLYPSYACKSQERFVLQIFSALCGESDPVDMSNREEVLTDDNGYEFTLVGSSLLPRGLRGDDNTARKALYGGKGYVGLSAPIREHILAKQNDDTKGAFVFYSKNSIGGKEFALLCEAFGLSTDIKRDVVYGAIYEQFLEFAKSKSDDVEDVIQASIDSFSAPDEENSMGFSVVNNGTIGTQKNIRIETVNGNITL